MHALAAEIISMLEVDGDRPANHDALRAAADLVIARASELTPAEIRAIQTALQTATSTLAAQKEAIAAELGTMQKKSRAVHGYARASIDRNMLRGQRVDRDS